MTIERLLPLSSAASLTTIVSTSRLEQGKRSMGSRLFVGNLPYSCTEEDLRDLFEPRFRVLDVRIVTDRETGRSRGFAFVELDGDGSAGAAIESLDGGELGGRRLAIREAHERTSKPQRRRDGERKQPAVEAVVRRGSSGGFRDTRRHGGGGDGRRWQAPPEPSGIGSWGPAPSAPTRKREPDDEPEW